MNCCLDIVTMLLQKSACPILEMQHHSVEAWRSCERPVLCFISMAIGLSSGLMAKVVTCIVSMLPDE